jgi:AraC-like DNA-binding protein
MLTNIASFTGKARNVLAAAGITAPMSAAPVASRPGITQILPGVREDLARFSRILRPLDCDAAIRSIDGITLLALSESKELLPVPALCACIHDDQGRQCASLDLITNELESSPTLGKLLRALIDSAARAVSERLFRTCYRDIWIVAARSIYAPDAFLLAVDAQRRVVGADYCARRFLEIKGCPFGSATLVDAVFELDSQLFKELEGDTSLRLVGRDDGTAYSVLVTPPYPGMAPASHERVLLHTRPRLDMLKELAATPAAEDDPAGLAPYLLRRIQQHINTNLESRLRIEELAVCAGMSVSYFSRMFSRSVGTSPHNYIMRRRVLRAQQLLSETKLDLTEIALSTGFADQSHFSRRFRDLVGLSPREFRQRHC